MNRCDTIGVIVPVYNNRPDLGQCVDSILAQTWPSLHLYLIDDGSADGSSAILDRYASDYPAAENAGRAAESASGGDFVFRAVTVVHKGNEGPGMTALRGIRESREEYLCFVDADDWIDSDMIANLAERRSFACPEVICANYVIEREWNGKSERVTNALPPGEYVGQRLETEVRRRILGNEHRMISVSGKYSRSCAATVCARRTVFRMMPVQPPACITSVTVCTSSFSGRNAVSMAV